MFPTTLNEKRQEDGGSITSVDPSSSSGVRTMRWRFSARAHYFSRNQSVSD